MKMNKLMGRHNIILENRKDIIRQYKDYIPVKDIAREYGLSGSYIYKKLKLWGMRRNGIKYLLGKMLLEGLF
uniref:Uncharacterized protein n=1 Tax=viral metagenome TaxID=1070528 RepID=A0A6H1ZLQ1_9ZZZZ